MAYLSTLLASLDSLEGVTVLNLRYGQGVESHSTLGLVVPAGLAGGCNSGERRGEDNYKDDSRPKARIVRQEAKPQGRVVRTRGPWTSFV